MKAIRILYAVVIVNYIFLLVEAIVQERWSLMFADIGILIWSSIAWGQSEKMNTQRDLLKDQNDMIVAQENLITQLRQNSVLMKSSAELREKIISKQQWIINQTTQNTENENTDKNS